MVHRHDDRLTPAALTLGDKQLPRVAAAWRTLNTGLRLRPVWHGAVHRSHAHVAWRVRAWFWARVSEHACGELWRHRGADLEPLPWAPLARPPGEMWQVTAPSSDAAQRLNCLASKKPPAVFHLAGSPTDMPSP